MDIRVVHMQDDYFFLHSHANMNVRVSGEAALCAMLIFVTSSRTGLLPYDYLYIHGRPGFYCAFAAIIRDKNDNKVFNPAGMAINNINNNFIHSLSAVKYVKLDARPAN